MQIVCFFVIKIAIFNDLKMSNLCSFLLLANTDNVKFHASVMYLFVCLCLCSFCVYVLFGGSNLERAIFKSHLKFHASVMYLFFIFMFFFVIKIAIFKSHILLKACKYFGSNLDRPPAGAT